ncbi:RNase L inhibitor [Spironucleus salmonicida]|uniref:RNase L inhibitor n=1 Tax=Spironucleus salmonicida TaxID=348837 RepID=V6LXL1_9EUKA|nr:RNase L inhibitor [Spironucleus salmonicida]|eukprot:EST48988.1 RNase L inhibitor [Spironucleus salmonicida]
MSQKGKSKTDQVTRIAVVNPDRCRPQKCGLQCRSFCPVNKLEKKCIVVTQTSKRALISENMCIGCDICVKKCPTDAIRIVNLPSTLDSQVSFRYAENSFRLHRLPTPRPGQVLGLVGENGTGKSTALQILCNELRPNFGDFKTDWDTQEIIKRFRGSELQTYFARLYNSEMDVGLKLQYVDSINKTEKAKNTVEKMFSKYIKRNSEFTNSVLEKLQLKGLMQRQVAQLSGGELQRFALAYVIVRDYDCYLIDEPSSYLDVKQRLAVGQVIRELVENNSDKYCIVVEHDLAILDYMSDFVSLLYGQPGVYGIITLPFSVRDGINIFLKGYIPTENMRFRDTELRFKIQQAQEQKEEPAKKGKKQQEVEAPAEEELPEVKPTYITSYPDMQIKLGQFTLNITGGDFMTSQIVLILGENGTGKSTFVKTIAGAKGYDPILKPGDSIPKLPVSYKPQTIAPNADSSVSDFLNNRIPETFNNRGFVESVVKPLQIQHLLDRELKQLSGGELQRVATILALGKQAEVYLIDEPSAYLDATQRLIVAKVIKRFILSCAKCCYIVEHDFLMSLYLADRVIVFQGEPGVDCTANAPVSLVDGMNQFLKVVGVTFRRDAESLRPRVNKLNSSKDKDQKLTGLYFGEFMDAE